MAICLGICNDRNVADRRRDMPRLPAPFHLKRRDVILVRMVSFTEQLQQIRARQNEDPLVADVKRWLKDEAHRFAPVETGGGVVEMLAEPELGGGAVRPPLGQLIQKQMGTPTPKEPGGNLGFSVYEHGHLSGHYIWPSCFDQAVEAMGWRPREARRQLVEMGHLHANSGRATATLPHRLAKKVKLLRPPESKYPRIRVIALRGLFC